MSHEDYYNLLEVSKTSTLEEIKSSYRSLAKKYHPDRNINNTTDKNIFKKITEAYQVLSNPEKRKNYDNFGTDDHINTQPFQNFPSFSMFMNLDQFEDFLQLNQNSSKKSTKNNDVLVNLKVTLKDIFGGCTLPVSWSCQRIKQYFKCDQCSGSGVVTTQIKLGPGLITNNHSPCRYCQGKGEEIELSTQNYQEWLSIPPGCREKIITFPKRGNQTHPNKEISSLIITLQIECAEILQFNQHFLLKHTLSLSTALLGGICKINYLDTTINLKLSKTIQSESFIVLPKYGMPYPVENPSLSIESSNKKFITPNKYGDLIIFFRITLPELSDQRKKLLAKILPISNMDTDYSGNVIDNCVYLNESQNNKLYTTLFQKNNNTTQTSETTNTNTTPPSSVHSQPPCPIQ